MSDAASITPADLRAKTVLVGAGVVGQVIGYGRNQENLEKGVELGVIDSFESSIKDCVHGADVIVVAVPLGAMQSVFAELKPAISDTAVITDVGSALHDDVERLTDRLATQPLRAVQQELAELAHIVSPIVAALENRVIPYPNPMGVEPFDAS